MSVEFLAIAIAGETGEMANIIKKAIRGDYPLPVKEIAKELADIITYCDLMMTVIDCSTESELIDKWNEVCERRNYPKYGTVK